MERNTRRPVAVLTGAGSGIGYSTALTLGADGYMVVAMDKDTDALTHLQGVAVDRNYTIHSMLIDVADPVQVADAFAKTKAEYGYIDALINDAGIGVFGKTIEETTWDEWNRVLAVNLSGLFLMCKAFLPLLQVKGGSIVNISSVHAIATTYGMTAYASAKAGQIGLTRSIAVDYVSRGVRCNCLIVGSVETPMTGRHQSAIHDRGLPAMDIAPHMIADPGQIAAVIRFLCSPDAGFINGAAITIDGGLTALL